MHFQRITSVQIFKKEESNIKNSEKTSATVYGGTAGKSKSTSPKDIEAEVQAAFEAVRTKHGIPGTPTADKQGLLWNPTRAIGTGEIKPALSTPVTGTQAGADSGGQSAADAATQIQPAAEPRSPTLWDLTLNSYSQGYYDSLRSQEAWKAMQGRDSEMEKYTEILNSDKYNFETDKWWQEILSGAAAQAGQWTRQITDPETLALAAGFAGTALWAGQAGPQIALPEEVITVPGAATLGLKVGSAKAGMEIEAGRAYLEMLNHGISEETAALLATGVGAVNGVLDTVQLDELMDAYRILDKVGADDTTRSVILQELNKRLQDLFMETGLETLQMGVSTAGTQIGSKVDTGEWAYTGQEVADRLGSAATSAILTYGLTNTLPAAHNIHAQNRTRLAALGEKKLCAGELPTPRELEAMNLSESEALGRMVLFQMEKPEYTNDSNAINPYSFGTSDSEAYKQKQEEIRILVLSNKTTKTINKGHQTKHIKSSSGYIPGRSYIYGDLEDAQALVDRYHGTGKAVLTRKGEWANKEMILAENIVGVNLDPQTGTETETQRFTIHYGKKGVHVVPAQEVK